MRNGAHQMMDQVTPFRASREARTCEGLAAAHEGVYWGCGERNVA